MVIDFCIAKIQKNNLLKFFFFFFWGIAIVVMLLVGCFLGWEFYLLKQNFVEKYEKLLSTFMVLLAALMASTAAIISINTTKELKDKEEATKAKNKQEEEQKVEQEEKIYMSYVIRNIEFVSKFYGKKFENHFNIAKMYSEDFNMYALQFKSLNDEIMELIKKLEDKKLLHVLFYRGTTGHECVQKLLSVKNNIYSISKKCEKLEKQYDLSMIKSLSADLLLLADEVIKIKDSNCS